MVSTATSNLAWQGCQYIRLDCVGHHSQQCIGSLGFWLRFSAAVNTPMIECMSYTWFSAAVNTQMIECMSYAWFSAAVNTQMIECMSYAWFSAAVNTQPAGWHAAYC
jgi:hypothetical protein